MNRIIDSPKTNIYEAVNRPTPAEPPNTHPRCGTCIYFDRDSPAPEQFIGSFYCGVTSVFWFAHDYCSYHKAKPE